MGQATLDLPDPLSQPAHGSAVNADDLLSQLAGDEIDRLLAEAEVERPEEDAATPALAAPINAPPSTEEALNQELDELHSALQEPDATPAGEEPRSAGQASSKTDLSTPESKAQLSTELNQLFDAINNPEPSTPPADLPAAAQALDQDLSASAAQSLPKTEEAAPPAATENISPVEKSTLDPAPEQSEELAATAALLESIEPTSPPAPLPIWLRPLEWLNAPLAGLSDSARSALGKAALITLFNAIVVLLYVLLFRK